MDGGSSDPDWDALFGGGGDQSSASSPVAAAVEQKIEADKIPSSPVRPPRQESAISGDQPASAVPRSAGDPPPQESANGDDRPKSLVDDRIAAESTKDAAADGTTDKDGDADAEPRRRRERYARLNAADERRRHLLNAHNAHRDRLRQRSNLQRLLDARMRPMSAQQQKRLEWRQRARQMADTYQRVVRGERMKRGLDRSLLDVGTDGVERFQLVYEGPARVRLNRPGKEVFQAYAA